MLTEAQAQVAVEMMLDEGIANDGKVKTIAPTLLGSVVNGLKVGGFTYLEILRNIVTIVNVIKEHGPEIAATVTDLYEQAKQLVAKIKEILGK